MGPKSLLCKKKVVTTVYYWSLYELVHQNWTSPLSLFWDRFINSSTKSKLAILIFHVLWRKFGCYLWRIERNEGSCTFSISFLDRNLVSAIFCFWVKNWFINIVTYAVTVIISKTNETVIKPSLVMFLSVGIVLFYQILNLSNKMVLMLWQNYSGIIAGTTNLT